MAHKRAHRSLHARVSAYAGASVAVVLVVAGLTMIGVERRHDDANIRTVADGLWWAATTVTTVGYGDRYPVTGLGRLIPRSAGSGALSACRMQQMPCQVGRITVVET